MQIIHLLFRRDAMCCLWREKPANEDGTDQTVYSSAIESIKLFANDRRAFSELTEWAEGSAGRGTTLMDCFYRKVEWHGCLLHLRCQQENAKWHREQLFHVHLTLAG